MHTIGKCWIYLQLTAHNCSKKWNDHISVGPEDKNAKPFS